MQDRGNQITLGTFISTFLFCVLVLRTVRTGEEAEAVFVPHLALIVALLFALASLGVLIYFIHHVPESIHISNVLASLGRDLHAQVEKMFPDALGAPASEVEPPADADRHGPSGERPAELLACSDGYLQYIDVNGLMKHARKHDLLVELLHRPGDFVSRGRVLAWVRSERHVGPEALDAIQASIVIGGYQSQQQDLLYLVNRLVEVAARALSPGMNDLFTATNAIDWLGSGLANLAGRSVPEDARRDDEGRLRIIVRSRRFDEVAGAVFDQLRPYVASDRNAALHLMRTLADLAGQTADIERRAVLLTRAKVLRHAILEAPDHPRDGEAIEGAYGNVVAALGAPRVGAAATAKAALAS